MTDKHKELGGWGMKNKSMFIGAIVGGLLLAGCSKQLEPTADSAAPVAEKRLVTHTSI